MIGILTTRRFCQGVFLLLFFWFCIVSTLGSAWWQLRGWPVNWLMELDPLVGLGTLLSTGTLYRGLIWGVLTLVLTIFLGRFFCGWLCPMGTLQHVIGYAAHRLKPAGTKVRLNRYRSAQVIKYWILFLFLAAAGAELISRTLFLPKTHPLLFLCLMTAAAVFAARTRGSMGGRRRGSAVPMGVLLISLWLLVMFPSSGKWIQVASLQTGWLDPLPLLHRSVNLVLIPLFDGSLAHLSVTQRYYQGAWVIGTIGLAALGFSLLIPRFYCRYICPLGALFGLFSRFAIWRIGKSKEDCRGCLTCERNCEGACGPSETIRIHECILCMNCRETCRDGSIGYRRFPSTAGEISRPDLTRRALVVTLVSGVASVPMMRLSGGTAANWSPRLVRPPGALAEKDFLKRCLKCGQCMRICPTNVIQPAGLLAGVEGIWTPVLNFRIGSSGCQLNCIACGHVCPSAAIRRLSLDEKLGRGTYASHGPIRLGTAFVDRGRCLPWAMDTPCIVCQENCPVSPKAIIVREVHVPITSGKEFRVRRADADAIEMDGEPLIPDRFATGDYFCRRPTTPNAEVRRIVANTADRLLLAGSPGWASTPETGELIDILIRLQQPYVDPQQCIGCGICEHECPVRGRRAIRVTAENETRNPANMFFLPT